MFTYQLTGRMLTYKDKSDNLIIRTVHPIVNNIMVFTISQDSFRVA